MVSEPSNLIILYGLQDVIDIIVSITWVYNLPKLS